MSRKTLLSMITVILALLIVIDVQGARLASRSHLRPGLTQSTATEDRLVFEYEFAAPNVRTVEGYDLLKIEGLDLYEQIGAPMVPMRAVKVSVPLGKQVVGTKLAVVESEPLPGRYDLPPGQKPYPLSYEGIVERTKPDPAIYGKSEPWPGRHYEEIGTQSKRGYQLFFVNLFPVQYIPSTGEVFYAKKMRLIVELADAGKRPVVRSTPELKRQLKRQVDNPAAVDSYSLSLSEDLSTDDLSLDGGVSLSLTGNLSRDGGEVVTMGLGHYIYLVVHYGVGPDDDYKYVVITNEALADSTADCNFQTLCNVKASRGISSCIVTTEDINSYYTGVDFQEKIRNFVLDAYQQWGTEYVLLGGNETIIPPRNLVVYTYVGGDPTEPNYVPADLYYGCVEPEESFDYDGDGLYGEPTDGIDGGDVDLFAEIYVGRASINTSYDLDNFVRKSLMYNLTDAEYLSRVSMLGEWLGFSNYEYAKELLELVRLGGTFYAYTAIGFENAGAAYITEGCGLPEYPEACWPMYDEDGIWSKEDVLDLMNGGIHIFNHDGHAWWNTVMKLQVSDLSSLTTTESFFVYSQGCWAGAFDDGLCMAEAFTNRAKGAFAVIMNSRYGWGGVSLVYNILFWNAVLDDGVYQMGVANQVSKESNYNKMKSSPSSRCTYYELNLFGDPELRIKSCKVVNSTQHLYYDSIQAAINKASDGDEIIVYPGTYEESVNFGTKAVTVSSVDPDDRDIVAATVIDGKGAVNTVKMGGASSYSALSGFTVTGGICGVYCTSTDADINRCVITGNIETGVYTSGCSADITNCIINDNGYEGVSTLYADVTLRNNLIDNHDTGVQIDSGSSLTIQNCTVVDNDSYGINRISTQAGVSIKNCILWNVDSDDLYDCTATYSCIEDGDDCGQNGNICTDPNFADADNDDYHLTMVSPCINASDPETVLWPGETDLDGQSRNFRGVDIGADEAMNIVRNGTTYYYSIQDAIDEALDGDEIVAYLGTYQEAIDFDGKEIALRSMDPLDREVVEATVIDGNGATNAAYLRSGSDSTLSGFTVTGAVCGVYCTEANTNINRCIITGNSETGVNAVYCSAVIANCIINDNGDEGVSTLYANTTLKNNLIYDHDTGVRVDWRSSLAIYNCTIVNNHSYGINKASTEIDSLAIRNCILWNNNDDLYDCTATYSCIEDGDGCGQNGNICTDPLFVNADANDFHLTIVSPCIDVGDDSVVSGGDKDIDGDDRIMQASVDMGADEVPPRVHNVTRDLWYPYIQDAIDAAVNGDEIVVYPDTYQEAIDFNGKEITVRSVDPLDWEIVEATIIEGDGAVHTVEMRGPSNYSALRGLTVTGGTSGVYCYSTNAQIHRCIIAGNAETGVNAVYCSAVIVDCIIHDNGDEGVSTLYAGTTLKNNLIYDHDTGVRVDWRSTLSIQNCTIVDNDSYGIRKASAEIGSLTIRNCILWNNNDDLYDCTATYSCIEDGDGCGQNGNICTDPNFVENDEFYHLFACSPCIDAGTNSAVTVGVDIDGDDRIIDGDGDETAIVDMGADEYDPN
jgi:hypothetical protein